MQTNNTEQVKKPFDDAPRHERLLWVLSGATFLIFFQAYMVAPLIPRLASVFGESVEKIGFIIPAYLIPYGVATLFFGALSDRIGRQRIIFGSLVAFILLTFATGFVNSTAQMTIIRLLTGLGASGVVPLALILIGDLFPYQERGRPLGWLFGAMAGGMAVGSTAGVMLEQFVSWRGLFFGVAILGFATLLVTLLSLGYDLTQPLLAGIVTDLGPQRGQAMGLNVFTLFVGFGVGSLIFGAMLSNGINTALAGFGVAALTAGLIAFAVFRSESHRSG